MLSKRLSATNSSEVIFLELLNQSRKHFLDLSQLSVETIHGLLLKAIFFAKNPPLVKKYEDKRFLFYFKEPSTRTSLSFQIAARNLGIEVFNLEEQMSSFTKGEDFQDALKVFESMGFDGLVMRSSGAELLEVRDTSLSMINAGSGVGYHPSQAMLDLATIHEHFGRYDKLKIAIVGDIEHSRVASSHRRLHQKLGNELIFHSDKNSDDNWKQIQEEADVVMMLRVQFERQNSEGISSNDYLDQHGLTLERYQALKKGAIVLHPGPFNRDIEIASEVISQKNVKIFEQVKWGVPSRMAIFDYALGGIL